MLSSVARTLVSALVLWLLWPAFVLAQQPAGVVTTLQGTATVTRAPAPQELPLKFRDDLFLRDRVSTKENSIVRALLGGKALVTVRELSVLTITEEVGRATVDMDAGKIALSVARKRLRPGETLEIRTPNGIAAVRGTVVVVEIIRSGAQVAPGAPAVVTNFHVLRGAIDVFPRGVPGATPVSVGPGLSLSIAGSVLGPVRPSPPVDQLVQGLKSAPQHAEPPAEAKKAAGDAGVATAAALATALTLPEAPAVRAAAQTTAPTPKATEANILPGGERTSTG